jgi:hypothetical protein
MTWQPAPHTTIASSLSKRAVSAAHALVGTMRVFLVAIPVERSQQWRRSARTLASRWRAVTLNSGVAQLAFQIRHHQDTVETSRSYTPNKRSDCSGTLDDLFSVFCEVDRGMRRKACPVLRMYILYELSSEPRPCDYDIRAFHSDCCNIRFADFGDLFDLFGWCEVSDGGFFGLLFDLARTRDRACAEESADSDHEEISNV